MIAAVNGAAVGAGLAVALTCDLRYASESATFSAPFIYLGTHPGIATTWLLPEAIGIPRAREMLYTGRNVSAHEALTTIDMAILSTDGGDDPGSAALPVQPTGPHGASPIPAPVTDARPASG